MATTENALPQSVALLAPQVALPPSAPALSTGFLDGLRGLAALYVCFYHASYMLHEGYLLQMGSFHGLLDPQSWSWLDKLTVFGLTVFGLGHMAVFFFFVLSGFVIHLRYSRQLVADPANASFGWPIYTWRRIRRLYPPLLLALLLTALCDRLALHLLLPTHSGQTIYSYLNGFDAPQNLDLRTFIGNLLFVMAIYVPSYGSDHALWSLACEWWFYSLYPLLWWIGRYRIWLPTLAVVSLFVLVHLPLPERLRLAKVIFQTLPLWWAGALLADVYTGRIRIAFSRIALLSLLLPLAAARSLPPEIRDIAGGLGCVGLISLCFWLQQRGRKLVLLNRLKFLGDMSYTLYVIHMPLLILFSGLLLSRSPTHRLPRNIAPMLLGILVVVLLAYAAHFLVEKPFTGRKAGSAETVLQSR